MWLRGRLKALLENVILKLDPIIECWFSKNRELKVGVLILWTLWMLGTANLQKNQGIPLYLVFGLYVGGYFVLYFICTIVALLVNRTRRQTLTMQQVDAMTGVGFENFCINILRKNGYKRIKRTKATGDQGIDIIAQKDNRKYAIQCKHYSNSVGNHSVMEACSGKVYYGCDIGVVMTNSTFTPQAKEHAKRTGVLLWDRNIIMKMLE